jgi:hypothetical protein
MLFGLAGCGSPQPPAHDGSTGPFLLEAQGQAALGLGYGQVADLSLRYLDDRGEPIASATVSWKIFGDPNGSTLSGDRGITGTDGSAGVSLTAGAAEALFRVVASADNASDLDFDVTVSKFAFVEIDPALSYTGSKMGSVQTLRALLYADLHCDKLPPVPTPVPPLRSASASGSSSAVLSLPLLLAADYALVGRAEDADGHLIAAGCVDLAGSQLPSGGQVQIPVPLNRVSPSVAGSWLVTAALPVMTMPSPVASWDALADCPRAPAQPILDALAIAVGAGPIVEGIAAHRGPLDPMGCRPAMGGNGESLDAALQTLLTGNNAPALALPGVVADLDAVVANAQLDSRLTLTAQPESGQYEASHTLAGVTLTGALGAHPTRYDLDALGFPAITVDPIDAAVDGDGLSLGTHGFTARLPPLWGRAVADVALAPRNLPVGRRMLLAQVVQAATRTVNNQQVTGCAAIEDLVCKTIAAQPCAISAACETALDALAAGLDACFQPADGIDLSLAGGAATAVDSDGDLVADKIAMGTFVGEVTLPLPPKMAAAMVSWSAERAQ